MDGDRLLTFIVVEAFLSTQIKQGTDYTQAYCHIGRYHDKIAHLRDESTLLPHKTRKEKRNKVVEACSVNELRYKQLNHERQLIGCFGFVLLINC
jgi:hypothetical protein